MEFKGRIQRLIKKLDEKSLDSFLVTTDKNVAYLTGFRGEDSILLLTRKKVFFLTDSRYLEEARRNIEGCEITLVRGSTYDTIQDIAAKARLKKLGFESMNLHYEVYKRLKTMLKKTRLAGLQDMVEAMREIKDRQEIEAIKRAAKLTSSICKEFFKSIEFGRTEADLASRLKIAFIEKGASAAFDPIVASDGNAALPHAIPGSDKIKKDCVFMADLGARLNGYNSDMTRTTLFGKVSAKAKKIYDIVKRAQELAIKAVAPGVKASSIDSAARGYIESKGFGRFFGHSVGHGVGLDVHEWPSISGHSHALLREGMVFTVEPAIYIPSLLGVRLEDMVLVTRGGCEVITGGAG